MKKLALFLIIALFTTTAVYAVTRNSYTKYGKHMMPNEYDPFFIYNFENCIESNYTDWTGTYRYVIMGKVNNVCQYKMQYNPWLKLNKNEWQDYKMCMFNDIRMGELSQALKEHSGDIRTYDLGPYQMTGTKLEYLLYSYEYYGACKLIKKTNRNQIK